MRGVFLDLASIQPRELDLDALHKSLDAWNYHESTPATAVSKRIDGADVVVSNKVCLDKRHFDAHPGLKLICVAATGTNNIDLEDAAARGITVSNALNYATASVTEAVFAMLLTLSRRLDSYRTDVASGNWSASPHFCLFGESMGELQGKTLGIVGYGTLGKAVATVARAFGMRVLVTQRLHGVPIDGRTPFPEVLAESDVISLHCPLSEHTRGLIGPDEFAQMKPDALLINTARGGIVNEVALLEALQQRRIAGAAIDVLEKEPPAPGNPLLGFHSQRLIITPHIAWASQSARQRLVDEIVDNIRAFRGGSPRNIVSPPSPRWG